MKPQLLCFYIDLLFLFIIQLVPYQPTGRRLVTKIVVLGGLQNVQYNRAQL